MRFVPMFAVLLILLSGCSRSAVYELPAQTSVDIPAQIDRLKSSCQYTPEEYALKKLYEYQAKPELEEYSLFTTFDQATWIKFDKADNCKIALATNTIEGMTYLLTHQQISSHYTNRGKRSIASALMWREYLKPKSDSKNLKIANRLINEYMVDEAKEKPANRAYYMQASYIYMDIADELSDKKISRALVLKALKMSREGFRVAEDKSYMANTYSSALYRLIDLTPKDSDEFEPLIDETISLLASNSQEKIPFAQVRIGFYQALAGRYDEAIDTFSDINDDKLKNQVCLELLDSRLEEFRDHKWAAIKYLIRKNCPALLP